MTGQQKEGMADSFLDAVKPGNIFAKVVQFIFFGLITATPYVVANLDQVADTVRASRTTGIWTVLAYLKALVGAMWVGVGIGLSTVFSTIIHIKDMIGDQRIGTILFSVMVMIFATLMIYQPMRLGFNILDRQKGRKHSAVTIALFSFATMLIVASPIAYLLTDGGTITSGITDDSAEPVQDTEVNESVGVNVTVEDDEDTSITNSLNMLSGGG